jgi:hypothetical protein
MTTMFRISAQRLASTLALAACICLAAGAAQATTWSTTALPWLRYPEEKPAGPLPLTIDIPPVAWSYAARTQMVDVFAREQPVIMRVTLQVKAGSVGVALANSDGSGLLSKEAALKPSDQDVDVYFRLRPATPQGFLLVRNYRAQGQAGSVVVKRVQFVREADLTNDELGDLVALGLH